MYSRVCVTGYINDPVPLIEKSRTSTRFPPSFLLQVYTIIITGLNKLCVSVLAVKMSLEVRCRQGVHSSLTYILDLASRLYDGYI